MKDETDFRNGQKNIVVVIHPAAYTMPSKLNKNGARVGQKAKIT